MDKKPLVTIVTITFNLKKNGREETFRQCLESVHNQTYKNIEHIVIDGASTDGTIDLIKEYADKGWVKYISEPDKGIYDAMNKGIKIANGKYIAFLNSDDFYHNIDAVKLSIGALQKNNADFSYADFILIGENRRDIVKGEIEKFLYAMPFGHPTMFIKTDVIKKEGGFDEKYKLPADYDLVIRLILKDYKNVYIRDQIASYRIGGLGSTTDHSDEIGAIYKNNYSIFCNFKNQEQAKKIMYESKLPNGFISNFKNYAKEHRNINVEKVVNLLIDNFDECAEKNNSNDLNDKKNGISIFLSSDNNYAPFVATTICSIMDNTSSYVNFYILDGGISSENIEKIKKVKEKFLNFSIEFIEIDTKKEFKNFPTRLHFSIDMYTRFLIPELRPDLKKVIYSDVDVIFNDDVQKLLDERLDNHVIGAVPYIFGYLNPRRDEIMSYHKRLKLSDDHKYFESGLLLIDADLWRKNNITEKLIREVENNPSDVILTPDQDVFNMVFDNNYKKLNNKYIVVPHRKKVMQSDIETRKSIEKPFIIHYAGADKPWNNPKMDMADYFWKYARMTSFYEELIFDFHKNNFSKNVNDNTNVEINRPIAVIRNKILFTIFSPNKFIKKYFNLLLNSKLRQPARKVWYFIINKKIKE